MQRDEAEYDSPPRLGSAWARSRQRSAVLDNVKLNWQADAAHARGLNKSTGLATCFSSRAVLPTLNGPEKTSITKKIRITHQQPTAAAVGTGALRRSKKAAKVWTTAACRGKSSSATLSRSEAVSTSAAWQDAGFDRGPRSST